MFRGKICGSVFIIVQPQFKLTVDGSRQHIGDMRAYISEPDERDRRPTSFRKQSDGMNGDRGCTQRRYKIGVHKRFRLPCPKIV